MAVHSAKEAPEWWDGFVESHSSLLFHQAAWGDVLREGYRWTPLYVWLEEEDAPVLAFLAGIYDVGFMRILYSSLPYGGLIGDVSFTKPLLAGLTPLLKEERIHEIRFAEWGMRPELLDAGFDVVELNAQRIDLREYDQETYLNALPRAVRKNIRRTEREGLVVEEISSRDEVEGVFNLYAESMKRNKAALKYSIHRFYAIYDFLIPQGLATILLVKHEGKLIASNTLVCSKGTVHDIQLSHDHAFQKMRPTDAVMFASVLWTIKSGAQYFDFMASPIGDENLERFKAKWIADDNPAATYIQNYSPLRARLWKLAQWGSGTRLGIAAIRPIRSMNRVNVIDNQENRRSG